jgi:dUTP pyrophosphatase
MELKIKIVNENAKGLYVTDKSDKDDSGLDLYVLEDTEIRLCETVFIDLGIQCEMLKNNKNIGYYLYPRSSISKTPLILANSVGIIDAGYRGNIKAAVKYIPDDSFFKLLEKGENPSLWAGSTTPSVYTIKKGTRLFQICSSDLTPFKTQIVNSLSSSERGEGGFGSTGIGVETSVPVAEPKNNIEDNNSYDDFCGFNS